MANFEEESAIPPDEMADLEEICRLVAAGKRVTDPELLRRIRDRSDALQRAKLLKYGLAELAADLNREARDDESARE
jgi:hypothetical protein